MPRKGEGLRAARRGMPLPGVGGSSVIPARSPFARSRSPAGAGEDKRAGGPTAFHGSPPTGSAGKGAFRGGGLSKRGGPLSRRVGGLSIPGGLLSRRVGPLSIPGGLLSKRVGTLSKRVGGLSAGGKRASAPVRRAAKEVRRASAPAIPPPVGKNTGGRAGPPFGESRPGYSTCAILSGVLTGGRR